MHFHSFTLPLSLFLFLDLCAVLPGNHCFVLYLSNPVIIHWLLVLNCDNEPVLLEIFHTSGCSCLVGHWNLGIWDESSPVTQAYLFVWLQASPIHALNWVSLSDHFIIYICLFKCFPVCAVEKQSPGSSAFSFDVEYVRRIWIMGCFGSMLIRFNLRIHWCWIGFSLLGLVVFLVWDEQVAVESFLYSVLVGETDPLIFKKRLGRFEFSIASKVLSFYAPVARGRS